ncbi:MAG: VIT domain-containing protein [Deltaproteobacteria bacterium]|nr:VIT domain-containing protein [Deltaproteobacteria bacterium]
MNRPIHTVLAATAFLIGAVLMTSCASTSMPEPPPAPWPESPRRPPPPPPPPPASSGAMVEEIIVTSARRVITPPSDQDRAEFGTVSLEEEIWIIAKASPDEGGFDAFDADFDDGVLDPRSGTMVVSDPSESEIEAETVPLPLEHTAVDASVAGHIGTVRVRQRFGNPFARRIEAVYVFPLPERAAVTEFLMVIGERKIRGILREKEEAEAIYTEALEHGYRASLLVQRRPNVFEQRVANIEPGKAIDVDIAYFHTLAYNDGWYSFVFPIVVGPQFSLPGSEDPMPAVRRGSGNGMSGAKGVEYLSPTERSGHDLSIEVRIDAGVAIEELKSTHAIVTEREGTMAATVRLADRTTLPNRDFVLDFRVAGELTKSSLMTYRDPVSGEGFLSLMVIPPIDTTRLERRPMEMVFVVDCSGSMDGRPLEQAKAAIGAALTRLNPGDTFQIIRFSDDASQFGAVPVRANRRNLAAARRYLARLDADGGTWMLEGVKTALDFPHDPARFRFVAFLTDGYIDYEKEILAAILQRLGASRIFSFGIGSSTNRFLLESMARAGRGVAAYAGPTDSVEAVMDAFFDRVSHAALTDIKVDWGGMEVADTYPSRFPDLFVGRPLVVSGRFVGEPRTVIVSGNAGRETRSIALDGANAGGASVAKVWARSKVADLSERQASAANQMAHDDLDGADRLHEELGHAIRRIALRHQLVSDYTSFVAVDTSGAADEPGAVTVHQAVPVPDGVRYETTVE